MTCQYEKRKKKFKGQNVKEQYKVNRSQENLLIVPWAWALGVGRSGWGGGSEDEAVLGGNHGASLSYVKRLKRLFPLTACKTGLFLCLSGWKCRPTVSGSSKQTKKTDDQVQTEALHLQQRGFKICSKKHFVSREPL